MKKKLFDFNHPFFEPFWVRVVTFLVCFGWGIFEFSTGATFWGMMFCGVGLVAGYQFFFAANDFTRDEEK